MTKWVTEQSQFRELSNGEFIGFEQQQHLLGEFGLISQLGHCGKD